MSRKKIAYNYIQLGKEAAFIPALHCLPGTQPGLDIFHMEPLLCRGGTAQGQLPAALLYTGLHVCLPRGGQHLRV